MSPAKFSSYSFGKADALKSPLKNKVYSPVGSSIYKFKRSLKKITSATFLFGDVKVLC
jgi:hypothetical protein